ncbi:MAG: hypothetical protein ACR2PF_15940 [Rhizobiaceae bacterium]
MQNEAALATALRVAEMIGAEIRGLFLEETELLEHAGFHFKPHCGSGEVHSALKPITHEVMRSAIKRETEKWRVRLSTEAEKRRLRWSFAVKPEGLSERLPREIRSHDLLVLIRDSISESLSPYSQQLIELAGQRPSLIIGTGAFAAAADAPIAAILEEGLPEELTLQAVSTLLGGRDGTLHLIVVTDQPSHAKQWADEVKSGIGGRHSVMMHVVARRSVAGIASLVNTLNPTLTIADLHHSLFQDTAAAASLVRSANPPFLLLGRTEDSVQKKVNSV